MNAIRVWTGCAAVASVVAPCEWSVGQFAIDAGGRADPAGFVVTTFASGLDYPTSMQTLDDGSLIVGVNRPAAVSGSFFNSTGQILRFADINHDGVADGPGQVIADDLPAGVTSVRVAGDLVVATSAAGRAITVLRRGASASETLTPVGSISFAFPSDAEHLSYALAVRPVGAGRHEVFFNIGSRSNSVSDATPVVASGSIDASLAPESIWSFELDDDGTNVSTSNVRQIASGLRNAAGMAFSRSGDLLFQDNGIDGTPRSEPLSADELNRIAAADIGGAVEHFGFASTYETYRTGALVGSDGVAPLATFQPIPTPDGAESEGANEIAPAPANWPVGLRDGVFVGFHGQFNLGGTANEENPLVWVDPQSGEYFHFISADEPLVGHLDGLLSTDDALFVADISSGSMSSASASGAIYRITYVPEPGCIGAAVGIAIGLCGRRRWIGVGRRD